MEFEEELPKIFVVKVTANQERIVAKMMYKEAKLRKKEESEQSDIYSILYAPEFKGYVLVEADNPGSVEDLARGIPKTKGILLKKKGDLNSAGIISINELEKVLVPTPIVREINKGDLIELIAGPFKGEKARVARISPDKNQITVELIEAAVPIPVIVRGYDIKIIKKEESEEESDSAKQNEPFASAPEMRGKDEVKKDEEKKVEKKEEPTEDEDYEEPVLSLGEDSKEETGKENPEEPKEKDDSTDDDEGEERGLYL